MATKGQTFLSNLRKGEFDDVLVELGEAVLARYKQLEKEKTEAVKKKLKPNTFAVVQTGTNWRHNNTVVRIEQVNSQTADTTVLESETLPIGKPARLQLSVLKPLPRYKRQPVAGQQKMKKVLSRGSR